MRQFKIKSKYKDQEFDYLDTPKHFSSITNKSIEKLRLYCLRANEIENKDRWVPSALEAMLVSVLGRFDQAHAVLEGDYSSRKSNLSNAYVSGLADVEEQLINIENDIMSHNLLFEEYKDAYENFTGRKIADDLKMKDSEVKKLREKYEKLSKELE